MDHHEQVAWTVPAAFAEDEASLVRCAVKPGEALRWTLTVGGASVSLDHGQLDALRFATYLEAMESRTRNLVIAVAAKAAEATQEEAEA